MAAPEDYVVAEHTDNQLDDLGIAGKIEKRAAAAHALPVVAFNVRRDQLFGTHAGVVAQQTFERFNHPCHARPRQAVARHHPAFAPVVLDLVGLESSHGYNHRMAANEQLAMLVQADRVHRSVYADSRSSS